MIKYDILINILCYDSDNYEYYVIICYIIFLNTNVLYFNNNNVIKYEKKLNYD